MYLPRIAWLPPRRWWSVLHLCPMSYWTRTYVECWNVKARVSEASAAEVHRHGGRTRETRRDARRVKVVHIWHGRLIAKGGPEGSGL